MYPYTAYPHLRPQEYAELCGFIESITGIVLGEGKEDLITGRLGKLLRDLRMDSFSELIRALRRDDSMAIRMAIVDVMTSKESTWFKDKVHYHLLANGIMPKAAKGFGTFRVWSVACASGQETYGIAMILKEYQKNNPDFRRKIDVLGTDFSDAILDEAKRGLYCSLDGNDGVSGLLHNKFFLPNGDCSEVRMDIKRMVKFRKLNLLDSYEALGRFDVIYCRSVLVYFAQSIRADVFERISQTLKPGGFLFLGEGEVMEDSQDRFEKVTAFGGSVYRLKASSQATERRPE